MLLEKGEFIVDSKTKQVCWIERISRETVEIGYATYENGIYGKDFVAITKSEFYEQYEDIERG